MIRFGRSICSSSEQADQREWLVTNGIGGYASGTLAGLQTRRYHGLLIAALKPPLGRTLLVTKLDETVHYLGSEYPLFTNRFISGLTDLGGYIHLESFQLEHSIPTWSYRFGSAGIEKRIWMQPGENTTYIQYTYTPAGQAPIQIDLRVLVSGRDHHANLLASQAPEIGLERRLNGIRLSSPAIQDPWYVFCQQANFYPAVAWVRDHYLLAEAERGEPAVEDQLAVGIISATLQPGEVITVVASTDPQPNLDGGLALAERRKYEEEILAGSKFFPAINQIIPTELDHLLLAADQFIVKRPSQQNPDGVTVLAGYPWFSDWGRDTMISLPGLVISTGRFDRARGILLTFAEFVDQGMLPNRFPDQGELPEYNTIDASLWYFEAIRAYFENTQDGDTLARLMPALEEIIAWHIRGTRYNIHCDPDDGLLAGGEAGMQLTWMDVRIDGWTVTPRIGKPVEINALWYNALCCMVQFCEAIGRNSDIYQAEVKKAKRGFARFWNPERGCLFDVLDGPHGDDPTLRPNQIIAASLANSPLSTEQTRAVLDSCARHLLTSYGLRSLAPGELAYIGSYLGDRRERDSAYHQGTVWGWLIGPFLSAHLRLNHDPAQVMSYLQPFCLHLSEAGLGTISEIFDGDPPFRPAGCFAQAWSVAEVLRILRMISNLAVEGQTNRDYI